MNRWSKGRREGTDRHRTRQSRLVLEYLEGRFPPGDVLAGLWAVAGWGSSLDLLAGAAAADVVEIGALAPPVRPAGPTPATVPELIPGAPPKALNDSTLPASPPAGSGASDFALGRGAASAAEIMAAGWVVDWWNGVPAARSSPRPFIDAALSQPALLAPAAAATGAVASAPPLALDFGLGSPMSPAGSASPLLNAAPANAAAVTARPVPAPASATGSAAVQSKYGQLPLSFEANKGQTDAQVKFLAHGPGYTLFLTATEAVMVMSQPAAPAAGTSPTAPFLPTRLTAAAPPAPAAVVRMQLVGADPNAAVTAEDTLPGKVNYFLGNDPAQWHTDVPTYSQVHYHGVYAGVDLVFYGSQQQPEYDFVASPGADLSRIRLSFGGTDSMAVDAQGNLLLNTAAGPMVQHKPVIYQEVNGVRQEVAGGFRLRGPQEVGFQVSAHDPGRPIVIDPVFAFSTYFGGSVAEVGNGIAVSPAGNVYLAGYTASADFPTVNAFQPVYGGSGDAFVAEMNSAGSALLYSTYLGGSSGAYGAGIAVDPAGNAFVTGSTNSRDFPTTPGAFQTAYRGVVTYDNAFVTKLSAAGSALVYSTYLGGEGVDRGLGIAVDSAGNADVTGFTQSSNFPTMNPLQRTRGGYYNAFVTKLNTAGSTLVYSTYLGGYGEDFGFGIAVDPEGDAYVTGHTTSVNFPTANALQPVYGGDTDAFVAELTSSGDAFVYSTYLGGNGSDAGYGIAVDPEGDAYVTGDAAQNFPTTPGAFQTTDRGGFGYSNAFVTKLALAGSSLVYSTYMGGSSGRGDTGMAISLDPAGDAFVAGYTDSVDFPTVDPIQPVSSGSDDAFVSELNPTGSALVYSTYLGGRNSDYSTGIGLDAAGNAYVTGTTYSANFPVTPGAFETELRGQYTAFVTKISPEVPPFVVTNTNDSGPGSLRQVILDADASPDPVTVTFDILGSGTQTIHPQSPLPAITNRVILDGTSQPGYAGHPLIALDGSAAGFGADGLTVAADGSTIEGLLISSFSGAGVHLEGAGGDRVTGSYLGTDATGSLPRSNGIGVLLDGASGNTIGGTSADARNLISGNRQAGVLIDIGANGNLLEGNFIGTDITGTGAVPNGASGITVSSATNTIGGTAVGAGNLISGNTADGIDLGGIHNQVLGNTIGTNAARTAALGNRAGIAIGGPNNTVGGAGAAARNVIAGNRADGVALNAGATGNLLQGNVLARNNGNGVTIAAGAANNVLWGNAIGTTPAGRQAYPNGLNGVVVAGSDNQIGGTTAGTGNVISGNTFDGIDVTGRGAVFNLVQGNFIGTDATGMRVLGNGTEGINLDGGAADNTIGGTDAGAGNVLAGNGGDGVGLADPGTTANLIQGNFIGTDPSGRLALGNGANGVYFEHNASGNTVGGTATGAGNTIAFNTDDGVAVVSSTGDAIQQNSISRSGYLGIELINGGNHNQAFPTLTSVTSDGSSTTITGTLNSTPDTTFTLEFFANDVCNPSGYGEGQTFLGSAAVTTDDTGTVTFTVTVNTGVAAGQFVSATTTDPGGNTSQFAACLPVPSPTAVIGR